MDSKSVGISAPPDTKTPTNAGAKRRHEERPMSFFKARPVATHDLYGPIHKGLRLALSQLLVRLGACDGDDPAALAALLADLRGQCQLSAHHLANEEACVHPALEARAPGATAYLARAHEHHRETFYELEALIRRAERAHVDERPMELSRLYLRFSTFVAEDFAHMAEEEQLILPVLQGLFTDDELRGIEDRIISGLEPDEVIAFGRTMIPAATRPERIILLDALRANAPAEAFAAILTQSARPTLDDADYVHLCEGLGIAAG
jgi:hypothetical protein